MSELGGPTMAIGDRLKQPQYLIPVLRVLAKRDWTSRLLDRTLAPFNPFDPRRYTDPYPMYDEVRAVDPLYWHPRMSGWIATGHAECEAVLRGPVSVDRSELMSVLTPYRDLAPETIELFGSILLSVDPPDHTRLRRLVSRTFTPRAMARLEPEAVKVTGELLDQIEEAGAAGGPVDVAAAYTTQLPIYMICELLGLPRHRWARLHEISDHLARFIDAITGFDPAEMDAITMELRGILDEEIALRREQPRDDMLTDLVAVEEDGDRLSTLELHSMVVLLMAAGHETTTGLIGNALVALDRDRNARQRLLDEPDLATNAVEELLRYDSPVQGTDRMVAEDFEIDGRVLRKGENVTVLLGAANHDPRMHDDPDRLLLDRPDPRPLSFGHGIHHCVGAALARIEARVAIPAFVERFPEYRVRHDRVEWKRSMTLRGPIHLPVDLGTG